MPESETKLQSTLLIGNVYWIKKKLLECISIPKVTV